MLVLFFCSMDNFVLMEGFFGFYFCFVFSLCGVHLRDVDWWKGFFSFYLCFAYV